MYTGRLMVELGLREWLAVAAAMLSFVVWLLRLEGRIAAHERVCEERQRQQVEARAATVSTLQRIESRLEHLSDRLIGSGD